ncbi:MAG TPA: 50S ribosomal protein L13 [Turneriella sp.]|nr:50S ribosomal protein L13 [Turneriella sp.]
MDPLKGQRSHFPKRAELTHNWVVVDAKDKILGRVSTQIASLLMGKNKVNYQPGQLVGDHVVVINASQVKLSGKKEETKEYIWHSRYYGGMKTRPYKTQMEKEPEKAVLLTVKGMLPKTKYGRKLLTRVRVFTGAEHSLQGQKPAAV